MTIDVSSQRSVNWLLERIEQGPGALAEEDVGAYVTSDRLTGFPMALAVAHGRSKGLAEQHRKSVSTHLVHIKYIDTKERQVFLRIALTADSKILSFQFLKPLPDGITVRAATEEDWEGVAKLEPQCGTQDKSGKIVSVDRGHHGADHFRLQKNVIIAIAEFDGQIVAGRGLPIRECILDGKPMRLPYSHFARVLPAFQSAGLFSHLQVVAGEQIRSCDETFAYMDPENDAMRAALGGIRGWNHRALRLAIKCVDHADGPYGERLGPEGLGWAAKEINDAHKNKFFFSPYTKEILEERLSRAPSAYGLKDLIVGKDAVLGVYWEKQVRTVEWHGQKITKTHAIVNDYGFSGPEGLEVLERLIRGACHDALPRDVTHLTLFTSDACAEAAMLKSMSEDIHEYEFFFGSDPEPLDIEERGLYIDPIYF